MTTSARVGVRVLWVGLALALVAGCGTTGVGGQADPTSTTQSGSDGTGGMPSLDPCKLLTAQELEAAGVPADSSPLNGGGEVGCQYAKDFSIGLSKSAESIDSYNGAASVLGIDGPSPSDADQQSVNQANQRGNQQRGQYNSRAKQLERQAGGVRGLPGERRQRERHRGRPAAGVAGPPPGAVGADELAPPG